MLQIVSPKISSYGDHVRLKSHSILQPHGAKRLCNFISLTAINQVLAHLLTKTTNWWRNEGHWMTWRKLLMTCSRKCQKSKSLMRLGPSLWWQVEKAITLPLTQPTICVSPTTNNLNEYLSCARSRNSQNLPLRSSQQCEIPTHHWQWECRRGRAPHRSTVSCGLRRV